MHGRKEDTKGNFGKQGSRVSEGHDRQGREARHLVMMMMMMMMMMMTIMKMMMMVMMMMMRRRRRRRSELSFVSEGTFGLVIILILLSIGVELKRSPITTVQNDVYILCLPPKRNLFALDN